MIDTLNAYTSTPPTTPSSLERSRVFSELQASSPSVLDTLSLAHNKLNGEVLTTFASPTLTHLDLSFNFLNGPINVSPMS
jgi:hypothetical protein